MLQQGAGEGQAAECLCASLQLCLPDRGEGQGACHAQCQPAPGGTGGASPKYESHPAAGSGI